MTPLKMAICFFYSKRGKDDVAPPPLPVFVEEKKTSDDPVLKLQHSTSLTDLSCLELMDIDFNYLDFSHVSVRKEEVAVISPKKQRREINQTEASDWINLNLLGAFILEEKEAYFDLSDLVAKRLPQYAGSFVENRVMNALTVTLKRSVYIIDPSNDRDLLVIEGPFPIPGDDFRYGERFESPLYLYKQKDGSYITLMKL